MARSTDLGYNTIITYGDKKFAGVTQDDLTLNSEIKESITKDDSGVKQVSIVRINGSISVAGLCTTDDATTVLDRKQIIAMVLAKQIVSVEYAIGTSVYEGSGYINSYKESTPASPDSEATYSVEITLPNGLAAHV